MNFRWNKTKEQIGSFWNVSSNEIEPYRIETCSDKDILNYPCGLEHRVALEALCRVVSELIEIEEKRQ
jgi:hypothetical protein